VLTPCLEYQTMAQMLLKIQMSSAILLLCGANQKALS